MGVRPQNLACQYICQNINRARQRCIPGKIREQFYLLANWALTKSVGKLGFCNHQKVSLASPTAPNRLICPANCAALSVEGYHTSITPRYLFNTRKIIGGNIKYLAGVISRGLRGAEPPC